MKESEINYFRRVKVEGSHEQHLMIKLSEKPQLYCKPSKNILKRWNLANGMLYLFYSVIGLKAPPKAEEILEPFYKQKRMDFVHLCCEPQVLEEGPKKRRKEDRQPKALLSMKDLKAEVKQDPDALTNYLRMCDRSLAYLVSDVAVRTAIQEGVWVWNSKGYWIPNIEKVGEWTFKNGCWQIFSRAVRMKWGVIKRLWDEWNQVSMKLFFLFDIRVSYSFTCICVK